MVGHTKGEICPQTEDDVSPCHTLHTKEGSKERGSERKRERSSIPIIHFTSCIFSSLSFLILQLLSPVSLKTREN